MKLMKFISYSFIVLISLGMLGVDTYLMLELFKQPSITWLILVAIWAAAFVNIVALALIVMIRESVRFL